MAIMRFPSLLPQLDLKNTDYQAKTPKTEICRISLSRTEQTKRISVDADIWGPPMKSLPISLHSRNEQSINSALTYKLPASLLVSPSSILIGTQYVFLCDVHIFIFTKVNYFNPLHIVLVFCTYTCKCISS